MIAIRELHEIAEFEQASGLFDEIWHFDPESRPISVELMRAMSHAGNYVGGAFDDAGRLVGASVGFFGAGNTLHSHITGAVSGHGTGLQLKLHQRRWALERGVGRITWTYDPLVRRNAHFNLAKLGARPVEYLPSFYGVMADAINQGGDSDRVLASWPLSAPHVAALVQGEPCRRPLPADAEVGLADEDGRPVVFHSDAPTLLVALPEDIETMRVTDPGAAKAWRLAVREVLGGLLVEGGAVTAFHDKAFYVVERPSLGTASSSDRV
ncbi:GNAT family N-acetyltransferase [Nonomuraea sp. WAC 01424]|uniref:GNAT family N-acetyltransferase n=1 Tax=Nonomuraea sp. WAC 01424 TaxID=2203200 RepID=UPI000F792229|nr:GNAT family N-acetyltransferase [Nonomuraea sp. WAC 01424]RSM99478.1 GNAT family N-acetyltransferase [Nonomuraea sp. WAC 01424]